MSYGRRLRRLRLMHSMTQGQLANRVLLSHRMLSRIERDEMDCPDETQQMLAVELGVTIDYLKRPSTVPVQTQSPLFRTRRGVAPRDKHAAHAWATFIDEEYSRLAARTSVIAGQLVPTPGTDPTEAARRTRLALGFTEDEPLRYLVLAAEQVGIRVLGLPFKAPTMDAISGWNAQTPVVAVMSGVSADQLRWAVAREIGHLILHQAGHNGQRVRHEADVFASELLTPTRALRLGLPRQPSLSSLTMVKTQWGVSIRFLLRRGRNLGMIDADCALSLYREISTLGWHRNEPGAVPTEQPRGLRKLAELCYGVGPNVARMARDAGWSEELTFAILRQHATVDDPQHAARVKPLSTNW